MAAPRKQVFRFLVDLALQSSADVRLSAVEVLRRTDAERLMKVRGYVVAPILESTAVLHVRLHPYERIEVKTQPDTISFPGRLFVKQFKGECRLEETDVGTRVVRTETYITTDNWLGRLLERRGDRWLSRQLADVALPRLKKLVELG